MLRIGNTVLASNLMLSPIAGYCDLAFRLTIRGLDGLGLASTDLVNARGLLRQTVKSMELVETEPGDWPLCIQLYGYDCGEMAEAAQWCQSHGASVIDINMGCPVEKVCQRRGGAALLREPERAVMLAKHVVRAVDVPVTVKMRLGWDDGAMVAPRLAAALEDVGVAAITIHGRTAQQGFGGRVGLEGIGEVVRAVRRIPVIGNGDVRLPADAKAMIDRTGCAGVMIGRAALWDSWIFRDTHALLTEGCVPAEVSVAERVAFMNDHFAHLLRLRGERIACHVFRQRISWYAKKLGPCRDLLDRVRVAKSAADYGEAVDAFLTNGHGSASSDEAGCHPSRRTVPPEPRK